MAPPGVEEAVRTRPRPATDRADRRPPSAGRSDADPASGASRAPLPDPARLPGLDGIRGIAILLVLLHHFVLYSGFQPSNDLERLVHRLALTGWAGVDLFFVLSGFLITGILWDARRSEHYFRNFYARRFLRIFPLYYAFLALFLLLVPRFAVDPAIVSLGRDQAWYWTYLLNVRIALHGWSSYLGLDHFWSLAVEEQFYLVWPLVVIRFGRRTLMGTCAACVVAGLGLRLGFALADRPLAAYALMPARMDGLAVGGYLALALRGRTTPAALLRRWRPAIIAAAGLVALLTVAGRGLDTEAPAVFTVGFSALAIVSGGLLLHGLGAGRSGREPPSRAGRSGGWLASPALGFFGRYSYALYLLHHPIALHLGAPLREAGGPPAWLGSQLPGLVAFATIGTALAVLGSLATWKAIEEPSLRLKRLFPRG